MSSIKKEDKDILIKLLKDLIDVIVEMRKNCNDFLLGQNEREARDWLSYLKTHDDIDEIYSLEVEVVSRFLNRFDVQICENLLDDKRVKLMNDFIYKAGDILHK